MKRARFDLEEIKRRIEEIRKSLKDTTSNTQTSSLQTKYECERCKDTGYIIKSWAGYGGGGLVAPCPCLERKRMMKRFRSAMIPEEFQNATLEQYKVENEVQAKLKKAAIEYLEEFDKEIEIGIGVKKGNSLGFLATVGESKIRELPQAERTKARREHNSYGLGKTHLQIAIAKELIKRGYSVLCVADVELMDELMMLKRDDSDQFYKRVNDIINVQVLVWDDIGKSNPSEAKRSMYFQIINERYKHQRPIIYSSNEDVETLADKIGDAAASRLLGMSRGRIVRVEGPDYRLTGGKHHGRTA